MEREITGQVLDLWMRGEYHKLDALAQEFRSTKATVPGGRWKLSVLHEALYREALAATDRGEAEELAKSVRAWTARFPKSPTATIQFANAMVANAWNVRGEGYASEVGPERLAFFRTGIRAAREYLLNHRGTGSVDPRWHELLIKTTTWSPEFVGEFDARMQAALQAEPLYWDAYFAGAEHLEPRWGGSVEKIEKFARESVTRLPAHLQDSYYAAIYWFVFDNEAQHSSSGWLVNCERWMKGLADIVATYPDPWNINNAARFANSCDDRVAERKYMSMIGDAPLLEAWGSKRVAASNFSRMKAWAELGPYFLNPEAERQRLNAQHAAALTSEATLLLGSPNLTPDRIRQLLRRFENFSDVLLPGSPEATEMSKAEIRLRGKLGS